jgi:hypothetical protein
LEIRLVDGELFVDAYWPNGCRLIAEGPDRFRLQSTSRRVTFNCQSPGKSGWLTYAYGGDEYHYDRR